MINLVVGDITKYASNVDVIVNAANETLLGGGGVDGAIHDAAGPELLKECIGLHGCPTGHAKLTKAYHIPCKAIIHAVGPNYRKDFRSAPIMLFTAYLSALDIAKKNGLKRIAFPSISTGIYAFPIEEAAKIALNAAKNFLDDNPDFEITWVLFNDADYDVYRNVLEKLCD